jgi:histidinol phosphatase-like enzyme (inositol monophosphatase family)
VSSELAARLEVAVSAARQAGQLTLEYFRREDLVVEFKADDSPVTVADRRAEQLLRARIAAAFPGDGILGEELGELAGDSGYRWILDPIDGTKSFVCGVPLYGTLVGVEYQAQSVVGVIYMPALDECIYAARGSGAWYTRADSPPRPARVRQPDRLSDAVCLTSDVATFLQRGAIQAFLDLQNGSRVMRTWGDCYGYLLVATGRADVMIDPILNIWDAAALQPVMQEAGGVFVDWQGKSTIHTGEGLGCHGGLLEQVLQITRKFPRAG